MSRAGRHWPAVVSRPLPAGPPAARVGTARLGTARLSTGWLGAAWPRAARAGPAPWAGRAGWPGPGRRLAGHPEAGQRRPRRGQRRIAGQDARLQVAQFAAGLHAQLVDQHAAGALVGGERLGLPPAAVQRQHELGVEPLPPRVVQRQLGQLTDQLGVPALGQAGVHPPLLGLHPERIQPRHLGRDQDVRRHVHQRAAAPQGQRLAEHIPGRFGAGGIGAAADRLAAASAQRGEPERVHLVGLRFERVPRVTGHDPAPAHWAEYLPEPLHVVPDGHPRAGRRRPVPDDLGQLVVGGNLPSPERQRGQDHPLFGRWDDYVRAISPNQ